MSNILGIYGIREEHDKNAVPWFISKEISKKHIKEFVKASVEIMNEWKNKYTTLQNYTTRKTMIHIDG